MTKPLKPEDLDELQQALSDAFASFSMREDPQAETAAQGLEAEQVQDNVFASASQSTPTSSWTVGIVCLGLVSGLITTADLVHGLFDWPAWGGSLRATSLICGVGLLSFDDWQNQFAPEDDRDFFKPGICIILASLGSIIMPWLQGWPVMPAYLL